MAEMVTKKPLFPGDCEVDELFKIFRLLGTPDEESWPGVTALKDWNEAFPVWPALNVANAVPKLSDVGVELVGKLIVLDPKRRLSATETLRHRYLADIKNESE